MTRQTHRPPDYVLICQPDCKVVGLGRFTVEQPARNRKYGLSACRVLGFEAYIQNYSSKRRYQCRAVVDGKLVSRSLRRIGPDS